MLAMSSGQGMLQVSWEGAAWQVPFRPLSAKPSADRALTLVRAATMTTTYARSAVSASHPLLYSIGGAAVAYGMQPPGQVPKQP